MDYILSRKVVQQGPFGQHCPKAANPTSHANFLKKQSWSALNHVKRVQSREGDQENERARDARKWGPFPHGARKGPRASPGHARGTLAPTFGRSRNSPWYPPVENLLFWGCPPLGATWCAALHVTHMPRRLQQF